MTYRDEFPDFPVADMPTMPEGFVDESWHNDACPCFVNETLQLKLWVDYRDRTQSELGGSRFLLCKLQLDDDVVVASCDQWDDMLREIEQRRP